MCFEMGHAPGCLCTFGNPTEPPPYVVTEGVESIWYYHLSKLNNLMESLCGKRTMRTNIRLESWGYPTSHLPLKWCSKCKELAKK